MCLQTSTHGFNIREHVTCKTPHSGREPALRGSQRQERLLRRPAEPRSQTQRPALHKRARERPREQSPSCRPEPGGVSARGARLPRGAQAAAAAAAGLAAARALRRGTVKRSPLSDAC